MGLLISLHQNCAAEGTIMKNTDILTEQGCFCLFVVRLTVRVLFVVLQLSFPTCYYGRCCGNNMCFQLAVWCRAGYGTIAHLSILFIVSSVL